MARRHQPMARGVGHLMYVGDVPVPSSSTQKLELAGAAVAAYGALQGKVPVVGRVPRLASAALAAFLLYRNRGAF